jgi:hypothetical protein
MERRHRHPEPSCGTDGVGDRIWDVVELEIEEDLATACFYRLDHCWSFRREKFQAYLAECRRFALISYGIEESKSSVGIGNIEGDDDFVLGSGR